MGIKVTAPVRIDISGGWPDSDPYRKDYGGIVLNGAINLRVSAYFSSYLTINPEDVPSHSGLGTSGALRAVELAASNKSLLNDKIDLIRRVHRFENEIIGHRAGFQDEAAAIYGGVNLWEFRENGAIKYKAIPEQEARHLEERIVIAYTGENHLSSNIHDLVFGAGNYERNISKLDRMKSLACEMAGNIDDEELMSGLIDETWCLQKQLHESIETDVMKEIQAFMKGEYLSAKATGAGGGGCMIFYTNSKDSFTKKFGQLKERLQSTKIMPFKFDYEGIKAEEITRPTLYRVHRSQERNL